jgi:hypothetical protein
MFRMFGTCVFLGVVLAALALAASAAVGPPGASDYTWEQQPGPPTAVLEVTLPAGAPDYNWAQREPMATHYELTQPAASAVALKVRLPSEASDYNWAQREPSAVPYEPTEPPAHH